MVASSEDAALHEGLLAELMVTVIERFTPWRSMSISLRDLATVGAVDRRVRRAMDLMRSDPGSVSNMASLARQSGMSRAQLFRTFESTIRIPPRVFLNMLRMEVAVADVMRGAETFASISDRLGFSAPAHFTRFFRDHAGANPGEFRNVASLRQHA